MASTPVKIEFRKVRDFGDTLNASFLFLRQNFKSLMLSLLFIAGPFMLVGSIIPAITLSRLSSLNTAGSNPVMQVATSFGVNFLALVVGLVMATAVIYEYIFLYEQSESAHPTIGFNELWQSVRRDFLRILLGMLGLAVISGGAIFIAVFGLIAILTPYGWGMAFLGVIFILFGSFYFLVPILMVFFPAFIYERVDFFQSLFRSFELVKGFWWQTFGLFIICFFISMSIQQFFLLPVSIFSVSTTMLSPTDASSSVSTLTTVLVATSVLATIAYTITSSLQMTVSAFQYFSLVERREATGLLEKIQTMGTENPTKADDFYGEEEEHY